MQDRRKPLPICETLWTVTVEDTSRSADVLVIAATSHDALLAVRKFYGWMGLECEALVANGPAHLRVRIHLAEGPLDLGVVVSVSPTQALCG